MINTAIPGPGPLTYDPKLPPSGFQYSILGKHPEEQNVNIGPGPNKYDIRDTAVIFDKAPMWSLGRKLKETKKIDDYQSTLHYNQSYDAFGKNAVSCKISGRHETKGYFH